MQRMRRRGHLGLPLELREGDATYAVRNLSFDNVERMSHAVWTRKWRLNGERIEVHDLVILRLGEWGPDRLRKAVIGHAAQGSPSGF